jgi:hypothetical protein
MKQWQWNGASGQQQTEQQVSPALAEGNQEHLLSSASEPRQQVVSVETGEWMP